MDSEKRSLIAQEGLPTVSPETAPAPPTKKSTPLWRYLLVFFLVYRFGVPAFLESLEPHFPAWKDHKHKHEHSTSCAQASPMYPSSIDPSDVVKGQKMQIVEWMSGAVKVPTQSYDGMGEVGEDSRWDVFYQFADCTSFLLSRGDRS